MTFVMASFVCLSVVRGLDAQPIAKESQRRIRRQSRSVISGARTVLPGIKWRERRRVREHRFGLIRLVLIEGAGRLSRTAPRGAQLETADGRWHPTE